VGIVAGPEIPLGEPHLAVARERGLSLASFKRSAPLARVQRCIGILAGLAPRSLLDIGSGRGTFLWPLLDTLADRLPVIVCGERSYRRAQLFARTAEGGLLRLSALQLDVCALPFTRGSFDVISCLEVLEHLERPQAAISELLRVADRFVLLSVPSRLDDNPEHIQFFKGDSLERLF
jgi:2-polyprenyl-3-methyl-5-hydroxy-6-metoxy-1,4-benzoquinol methylase